MYNRHKERTLNRLGEKKMAIREQIFQLTDVHEIVEHISEAIQKSIILENLDFELIAYSSPDVLLFDSIQQSTILTKRCPLFVIERLKKEGIVEQIKRKSEPIRLQPMEDIQFTQRVVVGLKHNGKLHGCLWIYETEQLNEEEWSLLTDVAPHLGKILFHETKREETNLQSVLWKILNDEYATESELYDATNYVSYTIPSHFSVLIASVKDPNYISILTTMKHKMMEDNIAYYLGSGTEIIGIIGGKSINEVTDLLATYKNKLEATLTDDERKVTFIGSGNVYSDVQNIRKSYLEALEVIEMMFFLNVEQVSCSYQELGIYRYIKLMYEKNINDEYYNEKIVQLMLNDKRNNSELVKTLWFYLKNNCRTGMTAQELFIHPNTLTYRIKQIEEIANINFDDAHERVELYSQLIALYHIPNYYKHYERHVNRDYT